MKSKYLLTVILIFAAMANTYSQAPNWQWARSAVGDEYDQSSTVATDAWGNVYVAGYFSSDSITFGTVTLQNSGLGFDELFIAKYDSSGNLLWVQGEGGSNDDKATALATDATGNVYLIGYFYSPTITFGSYTLTNAGNVGDIFIVKYDNMGNIIWAKREGAAALEIPYAIHVDATGNIIVAGRFSSNSITFGTTTLTLVGSMDVFVVKYDPSGNVIWAKGAGGGSNDEAYSVGSDGSDNIYVAGYFNQNAIFGTITLSTSGQADVFIAKYDATGTLVWAKKAGSNGDDRATGISVDASGNSYITGFFTNDSLSFGSIVLPNAPGYNSFIAKYDVAGNVVWANAVHSDSRALATAVRNNQLYVCGSFADDTLIYGPSTLIIDGSRDFFLLNCDTAGNEHWAVKQTGGGSSGEFAYSLAIDGGGNVYIAGGFDSDPIIFGPAVLVNTSNGYDMFVARLGATPAAIGDLSEASQTVIYPNPGNGQFTLLSNKDIESFEIYNITGEMVYSKNNVQQHIRQEVNISSLPSGIYFLKLFNGEKQITKKLIVQ